jgi:hypothetical protein
MLKPFLATAALLAITVGATTLSHAQDAGVLSKGSIAVKDFSKAPNLRQIAVEPSGITAKLDSKKFPALAITPKGVPADKVANTDPKLLVLPPSGGISSEEGNGIGIAPKIALPSDGIPSDEGAGNGGGNGGGKVLPIVIEPEGNPAPVIVNKGSKTGGTKTLPVILEAKGNPAPEDTFEPAPIDFAETAPVPAPETIESAPAETAAPETSAAPAIATVNTPQDLYTLLTSRGYGVEVIKRDGNGNLVFLVKSPDHATNGYVLLVDGQYGKVLYRKNIDLAAYGDGSDETYVEPSYTPAYNGGDNCETESYGY